MHAKALHSGSARIAGEGLGTLRDRVASWLSQPKLVKAMGANTLLALEATHALLPHFHTPPEQRAVVVCQGSHQTYFPVPPGENYRQMTRYFAPLWLLEELPNMVAAHLAMEWSIQGPSHCLNHPQCPVQEGIQLIQHLLASPITREVLWVLIDSDREALALFVDDPQHFSVFQHLDFKALQDQLSAS